MNIQQALDERYIGELTVESPDYITIKRFNHVRGELSEFVALDTNPPVRVSIGIDDAAKLDKEELKISLTEDSYYYLSPSKKNVLKVFFSAKVVD